MGVSKKVKRNMSNRGEKKAIVKKIECTSINS